MSISHRMAGDSKRCDLSSTSHRNRADPSTKPLSSVVMAPVPFTRVQRIPKMKQTAIGGLM